MRILLVSYFFPPYNTVGAVRPGKLAKYLIQHGHEVEVLCACEPPYPKSLALEVSTEFIHQVRGWSVNAPLYWFLGNQSKVSESGLNILGIDRPWLRALGRLYKTFFHWPDAEIGWVYAAIDRGMKLIKLRSFDVIYVSAPPFSSLLVGAKLSDKSGIPWVAEFRDLWTCNHAYNQPKWRLNLERYWESRLLKSASALITVSYPLSLKLERHKLPVWVVQNGYDADDYVGLEHSNNISNKNELLIVYTGSIYQDFYDLETFCKGLSLFVSNGYRVRVQLVGRNISGLVEAAIRYNLISFFEISSTIPRSEAIYLQKTADVLLMFLWDDSEQGIYTTKFFEYLGAGRPLLAIGSINSDVGAWIHAEKLGTVAQTPQQVADELTTLYQKKLAGFPYPGVSSSRQEFTRSKQFSLLVDYLQSLLSLTK